MTMRALTTLITTAGLLISLSAATRAQDFTVTGTMLYTDKGWGYNGWSGTDNDRPIRRADVSVLNNAGMSVLGTGSTDQDGNFSITVPSQGVVDLVVRVDCDTDLDGGFQRIRVTTTSNAEYQTFSPVFAAHDTSGDLDIGTVVAGKILAGGKEANPFNMFDMGVHASEYVTGPLIGAGNAPQTIRLYWPGGGGSFASGNKATIADDDGYDDAVILHELGHVIHNMYSDSDSDNPGGSHFFGDSDQNPALSLGEGYATFFGSTIMIEQIDRQAIYQDANGSSQTGGSQLRLRLENAAPYGGDARGAADEVAVACTLYDILDGAATSDSGSAGVDDDLFDPDTTMIGAKSLHEAWWDVFTGPMATAASLNINHCWDGWFSEHGALGMQAEMEDLYGLLRLDFVADVDEPNGSLATAAPAVVASGWKTNRTLYYSTSNPPAPGSGDQDWYAFEALKGSVIDFETRYPGGAGDADTQCDTQVEIMDPSGQVATVDAGSGTGRNGFIDGFALNESGTWYARVRTLSATRRYGRYDYRLQWQFENLAPVVTAGPSASPASIDESQTTVLSVIANDPNAGHTLTYAWTPLDGGSVTGAGANVTFTPPAVGVSTDVDIELVITDSLGAETGPLVVTVSVDPAGPTCGAPASVSTGGVGKPGLNGVPSLVPVGLPVVPSSGFALSLTNSLPGGSAYLAIGLSLISAPFDGGTLYPTPDLILNFTVDGNGDLFLPLPTPNDPTLCGLPVYWQILVTDDPGATGFRKTSQSNYVVSTAGT